MTEPLNRWEKFMAKIAGQDVDIEPLNREEQFYDEIAENVNSGGGGGSGGGALVVGVTYDESTDASTCDKTWAEINAAVPLVYVVYNGKWPCPLSEIRPGGDGAAYSVSFYNFHSGVEMSFSTDSENGYPSTAQDEGGTPSI